MDGSRRRRDYAGRNDVTTTDRACGPLVRWIIHPRTMLVALAVAFALIARWTLEYRTSVGRVLPAPRVFAALALVGCGCAVVTLLGIPTSRMASWWPRRLWQIGTWKGWHSTTGAVAVVVCWIRGTSLAWANFTDPLPAEQQAGRWIAVTVWAVMGQLILTCWFRVVIPWVVRSRHRTIPAP